MLLLHVYEWAVYLKKELNEIDYKSINRVVQLIKLNGHKD